MSGAARILQSRWPSLVFHLIDFNVILRPASYEPEKDIERLTVLKSVHIFKKHRVQYEMRTHYRCIEVRIQDWDLKPAESDDIYQNVLFRSCVTLQVAQHRFTWSTSRGISLRVLRWR